MRNNKENAKVLLLHYFNLCYNKATGQDLDRDNEVEIEGIIEHIFDGIKDEVIDILKESKNYHES